MNDELNKTILSNSFVNILIIKNDRPTLFQPLSLSFTSIISFNYSGRKSAANIKTKKYLIIEYFKKKERIS